MASLQHFPILSSDAFRKPPCPSPVYSSNAQSCRYLRSCLSINACSSNEPRGKKKAKSNADLSREIRNFLSIVGLPEDHMPSFKELSQNGRRDLANIVRRRGYKLVEQQLKAPTVTNSNASSTGQDENPNSLPNDISADSGLGIRHANEEGQERDSVDAHVAWTSSKGDLENKKLMHQAEVKRLELILHQREGELKELKHKIEQEELALSVLQTKAETEISNIKALLSETDIELQAVQEDMPGLKEVEIQYSGGGENVELAGSFNGWHHKIKMYLAPSSSVMAPTRARTSQLWTAVLWLYPGVYEIKFIVDGRWTIDPHRESKFRGFTHNNILRVH